MVRRVLPDSDSESEPDLSDAPSDKQLEKALRDAVGKIYRTQKMEELTVKRVRLAAEKSLRLEEGFFKASGDWKARSEQIIRDEVEVQDAAVQGSQAQEEEEDEGGSTSPPTMKPTKRPNPKISSAPRKRRKMSSESELDDEGEEDPKSKKRQKPVARKAEPELLEEILDGSGKDEGETKSAEQKAESDHGSESEMSVVFDEEPKQKRLRQKSAGSTSGKAKKKAPAKAKDADVDPNHAEIKRLQGWLIKCGIRKMWARELAPYETPKAKIKHLKDMLKDAGMEGRYSVEKARQIKEERELREDLEMVQEGAKRWGREKEEEEEGIDSNQPRRRLNRGLKSLAFLESDGEETD
ncbi:hypothetical protein BJX63DRAFT_389652 [Aspergillus granulosus]|uniref:Transcriptional regulator n=1 Tax=Aspergillus granulosus TaxID=176169 RepID=A0ABR4HJY0_9EURO